MLLRFYHPRTLLRNADPGGGGGVTQPPPSQPPAPAAQPPAPPVAQPATELLGQLLLSGLQSRPQGQAAVQPATPQPAAQTPEQAALLAAYQQLGTPEQLQQQIADVQRAQRQQRVAEVAEAAKVKPAVLGYLAGERELELREVEQNGTKVRQAYIKDGETWAPLVDFAARAWADFLPALQATPPAAAAGATAATGAPWPAQAGGGTSQTNGLDSLMTRHQAARDAAPNPLKRS